MSKQIHGTVKTQAPCFELVFLSFLLFGSVISRQHSLFDLSKYTCSFTICTQTDVQMWQIYVNTHRHETHTNTTVRIAHIHQPLFTVTFHTAVSGKECTVILHHPDTNKWTWGGTKQKEFSNPVLKVIYLQKSGLSNLNLTISICVTDCFFCYTIVSLWTQRLHLSCTKQPAHTDPLSHTGCVWCNMLKSSLFILLKEPRTKQIGSSFGVSTVVTVLIKCLFVWSDKEMISEDRTQFIRKLNSFSKQNKTTSANLRRPWMRLD